GSPPGGNAVTIRLLLADDQHLVRAGLAALLNLEPDLQVVQQLPDGTGVVEAIDQHAVDVAVLDIEMPEVDGITATQQIFEAYGDDIAALLLTPFGRAGDLQRTMAAGARGFMVHAAPAEQLAAASRTGHAGGRAVDQPRAAEALSAGTSPLTDRERDVLTGALTGASVKDMVGRVHLST